MPKRIRDAAGSALAVVVLFAALVSFDPRARTHMAGAVAAVTDARWSDSPAAITGAVGDVFRDLRVQNMFLVSMVAAGVVLVVLMLRT
jgi:hypothetical protein